MEKRIKQRISSSWIMPAVGQGAVGLEAREDDKETLKLISVLQHDDTADRITAERALNKQLEGGCQVPIAMLCHARRRHITPTGTCRRT